MPQIRNALRAIREHARFYWKYSETEISNIKVSKIDIACDFRGCFITDMTDQSQDMVRDILQKCLNDLF